MPLLPAFNPITQTNHSPHVVILGAGASRAALPQGDAHGKRLPVMADLIESLGLAPAIADAGFSNISDFESLYDEIATSGKVPGLKAEIEAKVQAYFEALELPESPTLYDHLVLSLRNSDYIATFNWDPFLAQAFRRNRQAARMPKLLFLHGNVEVGICPSIGSRVSAVISVESAARRSSRRGFSILCGRRTTTRIPSSKVNGRNWKMRCGEAIC